MNSNLFGPDLTKLTNDLAVELTRAIRQCPYSRDQIASFCSAMLGRRITKSVIDNITSRSKPHQPDADLVVAICAITNSSAPLSMMVSAIGHYLVPASEVPLYRLHLLMEEEERLQIERAGLRRLIDNNGRK